MFVLVESSVINFNKASDVRGHYVYKTVWTPFIGETLAINCEEDNLHDRYSVVVYLNDSVVRHLLYHGPYLRFHGVSSYMVTTKDEYTPGLEYTFRLLFEGRRLCLNPSNPPTLYLRQVFIRRGFLFKEIRYIIKYDST